MKYQLVLQWPASTIEDYDTIVSIEEALSRHLSEDSEVDGHDAGAGEMNIFIYTNNPSGAFDEVRAVLGTRDFWSDARVAYREMDRETYKVLWPKGLSEFKVS